MVDVTDFNPVFGTRLDSLKAELDKEGIGYSIASGYRSPEYQNRMYQNHQAKLAGQPLPYPNDEAPDVVAKPWSSFHNFGLAADFSLKNDADYPRLQAIAPQFGLTGIGMSDKGHIQLSGSLADDIAQYKLAGWRPESSPAPTTGALAYSGPVGALANQGPETVGSNQAYKFTLPDNAPMGMGNNNPLNIKYYKGAEKDYSGLVGPSSNTDQGDPQMKFASPEAGWNAAYNLLNKKYSGGMTTPNQIIAGKGGWTPGNTQAAANVAKAAGVGPDDDIGFSDPNKAQKFMRALVTQEQGAAAKAYPDEMIAAAVGGNAPAAGAASSSTTAAPAVAAAPVNQSWWSKLTSSPVDAQGNPTGDKSPLQQLTQGALSKLSSEGQTAREEAPQGSSPAMEQAMNERFAPGARNVSPMGGALLPSVPQTYGQTINSLSAPLTWNSAPPRAPQTPAAGLRGSPGSQIPGMSLTSVPAMSQGLGYGIDPNDLGLGVGYG